MTFLLFVTAFAILCNAFSIDYHKAGLVRRDACPGNTPDTRDQWCDLDIHTDYENVVPDTGVVREFWLEVTEVTVSPDGFARYGQAVNGTIPGPTLVVDWGDTVIVHVANNLKDSHNGTSIHFHGMRQNFTNSQDGVSSITECPSPPGSSVTYKFRATQYGTSWYHSHFALQTYDGVFGGVIINGPASANYDEDAGMIMLNDWAHLTVDNLQPGEEIHGPPSLDNGLINGMNVYNNDGASNQTGERFEISMESNKTYRLRFVNGAMDSLFRLSVDSHVMKVIAVDFVPIIPYETDSVNLGIGQRIDILITTDQAHIASSFWLRAKPLKLCSKVTNPDNVKGIIHYGSDNTTPNTTTTSHDETCLDENPLHLVPVVPKDVEEDTHAIFENATLERGSLSRPAKWFLNSTTMVVDWHTPSLLKVDEGIEFNKSNAVIHLPEANKWASIAIETDYNISHPIHLHGYDFRILAQGHGRWSPDVPLKTENPPRRDTAVLPANGYLVLAFYTDNPGVWLMHCHIGWHAAEGFSLQWVVREDEISGLISDDERKTLKQTCKKWNDHTNNEALLQEDSGI
ncbi:Fc.00g088330.m01.CDS01 [Cosmosporella sp. VM-42]